MWTLGESVEVGTGGLFGLLVIIILILVIVWFIRRV